MSDRSPSAPDPPGGRPPPGTATPLRPEDRAAALAAGSPGVPRRFVYWAIGAGALVLVLGLLGERLFSDAGLNPVAAKVGVPRPVPARPATPVPGSVTGTLGASLPAFLGLTRLSPRPAPPISLVDQTGRPVTLAGFAGKTVVLTFFDGRCRDICPVLAAEIRAAEADLGPRAAGVEFLTVNTDPRALAVSALDEAVRTTGLGTLPNWRMLTGPLSALDPVWVHYGITITVSTVTGQVAHTDLVYFVDPSGRLRDRATPVADESRVGAFSLPAASIAGWGTGIAAYASALGSGP